MESERGISAMPLAILLQTVKDKLSRELGKSFHRPLYEASSKESNAITP